MSAGVRILSPSSPSGMVYESQSYADGETPPAAGRPRNSWSTASEAYGASVIRSEDSSQVRSSSDEMSRIALKVASKVIGLFGLDALDPGALKDVAESHHGMSMYQSAQDTLAVQLYNLERTLLDQKRLGDSSSSVGAVLDLQNPYRLFPKTVVSLLTTPVQAKQDVENRLLELLGRVGAESELMSQLPVQAKQDVENKLLELLGRVGAESELMSQLIDTIALKDNTEIESRILGLLGSLNVEPELVLELIDKIKALKAIKAKEDVENKLLELLGPLGAEPELVWQLIDSLNGTTTTGIKHLRDLSEDSNEAGVVPALESQESPPRSEFMTAESSPAMKLANGGASAENSPVTKVMKLRGGVASAETSPTIRARSSSILSLDGKRGMISALPVLELPAAAIKVPGSDDSSAASSYERPSSLATHFGKLPQAIRMSLTVIGVAASIDIFEAPSVSRRAQGVATVLAGVLNTNQEVYSAVLSVLKTLWPSACSLEPKSTEAKVVAEALELLDGYERQSHDLKMQASRLLAAHEQALKEEASRVLAAHIKANKTDLGQIMDS